MKKTAALLLVFAMLLSSVSFAVPVIETVETLKDITSLYEEEPETSKVMAQGSSDIVPGLNMINGKTTPYTFEGAEASVPFSVTAGTLSVAQNPHSDSVNSSSGALVNTVLKESGNTWPVMKFITPVIECDRPVYVGFKYYKTYNPALTNFNNAGFFCIMKNGDSIIAKNISPFNPNTSTWQTFSGVMDFTVGGTSLNDLTAVVLEYQVTANVGYPTLCYFDDISYIPAYKVSYVSNDGTDTLIDYDYFLLDESGAMITSYTPDLTPAPNYTRYKYNFAGWSTDPDATEPSQNITIIPDNKDIVLYAVWQEDETLPDSTSYFWDFETEETKTWEAKGNASIKYENGIATMTSSDSTAYFTHEDKSLDTRSHRYLVVNARSKTDSGSVKFNFRTSNMQGFTSTSYVSVPIETSNTFKEYCIPLTEHNEWTGNYIEGKISAQNEGTLEIESIGFVTLYEPEDEMALEYHYPLSSVLVEAGGHTTFTANADGTYTFKRDSSLASQGMIYLPAPAQTLASSVYNKLVIVTEPVNAFPSMSFYYSNSLGTNFAAERCLSTDKTVGPDGTVYYAPDFSEEENYVGDIYRYMISVPADGEVKVKDIYLTNKFVPAGTVTVEKQMLSASSDVITTEGGNVILKPYTRYSDGSEKEDYAGVKYITDSVNAKLTRNADNSVTLTGKINGEINVTAILADGTTLSRKITISGQTDKVAANSFKVMMLGNSIRRHGESPEIGWYGKSWGMAASSEDKDYAHRFIYYMNEKYGEGAAVLCSGAAIGPIERTIVNENGVGYSYWDFIVSLVEGVREEQPDIITIQMGENVGDVTKEIYEDATTQLVSAIKEAAPDAIIVITTPFWPDYESKQLGAYATGETCGVPVAKLHTLYSHENMAYDSPFTSTATNGVKMHPGDLGMDGIAKLFFNEVNLILSENEKTLYTDIPTNIEINADTTSITTPYGTLQLEAEISPADAAQDVVWSVDNTSIGTVSNDGLVTAKNNGKLTVTAKSRYKDAVSASVEIDITGQTLPYTVTFDKNTTDVVANMPEAYPFAKDYYEFESVYPVRETYTFLGWSRKPDGEVISGFEIAEDTTVYAIWKKADSWSFDRADYKEEFKLDNAFNQYVLDGKFMAMATYTNVQAGEVLTVNSPVLDLAASDYRYLVMRMQNTVRLADTKLNMTVKTTNGNHTFSVNVTSTDYVEYVFPLTGLTGTITGFTFTPTNVDCTINMDEIAFLNDYRIVYNKNANDDSIEGIPESSYFPMLVTTKPTREGHTFLGWSLAPDSKLLLDTDVDTTNSPVNVYAVWDKNDHWEFNTQDYAMSGVDQETLSLSNGVLTYTGVSDPILWPNVYGGYQAKSTDKINIRMKWHESTDTRAVVFFKTDTYTDYGEASNVVYSGVDGWQDIELNIGSAVGWSGKITFLRFDPTAIAGTASIDYIRFVDSEANIVIDRGESKSVSNDTATYIVRTGATVIPTGKVTLKNFHLSGKIDMSCGYITVTDTAEVAKNSGYGVFAFDSSLDISKYDYMFISGYSEPVEIDKNLKYVVELSDGVGFVTLGSKDSIKDIVTMKVTYQGSSACEKVTPVSYNEVSVRSDDYTGIRFMASVANALKTATISADGYKLSEYGFIVSNELKVSDAEKLSLSDVNAGNALKGVAYDGTTNIIYAATDTDTVFTAALTNIPANKDAYNTKLYIRPYVALSNGAVIYGNAISISAYEAAQAIVAAEGENAPEYAKLICNTVNP